MSTVSPASVISPERLAAAYSYASYRQLVDAALAQGHTTGPQQSEALTAYTALNVQRMSRLDKTVKLLPELSAAAASLTGSYIGLIITEGWCGDASHTVPLMQAVAQASGGHLETRYFLRDTHPDFIDRYLTNGGRAIPIAVVLHRDSLTEAAVWGPRPAPLQGLMKDLKARETPFKEIITQVNAWYAQDATRTTQHELLAMVQKLR